MSSKVVEEKKESRFSQKWLTLRIGVAVALSRRDIQLLSLLGVDAVIVGASVSHTRDPW
jgi:3-keto-L-gulonate-6-phosphate decarboxylase